MALSFCGLKCIQHHFIFLFLGFGSDEALEDSNDDLYFALYAIVLCILYVNCIMIIALVYIKTKKLILSVLFLLHRTMDREEMHPCLSKPSCL